MNEIPVSTRAVVQRINRRLKGKDLVLKKARGEGTRQSLGEYFVLDVYRNFVTNTNVDVESVAQELGVLGSHETVVHENV